MLRKLVEGRGSHEPLFSIDGKHHTKAWLIAALKRFCRDAGVPYVCPHSLKGLAGSILATTGELADKIADHLSHEFSATSERHYIRPGVLDEAQLERGIEVFDSSVDSRESGVGKPWIELIF